MTDRRHQLLIVGAGVAGAAAALGAAHSACGIAGIDRDRRFGGTASRAGGGYCAVGTLVQREQGIDDSPALALADLLRGQEDLVDLAWARKYLRLSLRFVHEVIAGLGVETAELIRFERDSVPRWHRPVGGGAALMAALQARLQDLRPGEIWTYGLRLRRLQTNAGRVTGVIAEDARGHARVLTADAVILATGGFAQNPQLVSDHGHDTTLGQSFLTAGGPMARGDALAPLAEIGAGFTGLDRVYFYAFITADPRHRERGVAVRGLDRGIWLNAAQQRFLDESTITLGQSAATALFGQPGSACWAVVDSASFPGIAIADHFLDAPEAPADALARFIATSPDFVRAETLDALAAGMGAEAEGLGAAVAQWNTLVTSGQGADPLTGRALDPDDAIRRPPFLAVRLKPGARKTLGGVRTDLHGRVLDIGGAVIPGLYAAGEVAGFAGGSIAGKAPLEGMMVGASFLSGLIAGRHASCFVTKADPTPPEPCHLWEETT